jgi:hypothetical protein
MHLLSPIRATCPAHLILLDFMTGAKLGEEYTTKYVAIRRKKCPRDVLKYIFTMHTKVQFQEAL